MSVTKSEPWRRSVGTDPSHPWLAVRTVLSYNYSSSSDGRHRQDTAHAMSRWLAPESEPPRQCGEKAGQMTSLDWRIIDREQELAV